MRSVRLTSLASIGLLLAVTSGCYRPYVQQYGHPSAPVQTLTPGGSYAPSFPGGVPSGVPTPADSFGQPTPNSTFPNGTGGDAPFYNQSNSPPPYSGGGVPTYPDADEVQFQTPGRGPVADDVHGLDEFGSLQAAGASTESVAKVPVNYAEFFEPVPAQGQCPVPTQAQCPVPTFAGGPKTVATLQPPYAHDAEGFRWLRGVARRNPSTGNWSIIYNTTRTSADPYDGWLTLAACPLVGQLQPNGMYLISGRLDDSQTDPAGKPLYRVHRIEPWQPPPAL